MKLKRWQLLLLLIACGIVCGIVYYQLNGAPNLHPLGSRPK